MEPYGGGSEVTPASKSLIACSFSNRALDECRRPGVGVLNRGTPSLLRIPSPYGCCAVFGKEAAVFLEGIAKMAGSKNVIPPFVFTPSLLYVLRTRSPRPKNVREALDDRDGPAAENEGRSPGTCPRAQAPARLKNEEKPVPFDALVSIEKGMRGIHDEGVGLGGEV